MPESHQHERTRYSREQLSRFLLLLDSDTERAWKQYAALRNKLLKFFQARGNERPEELTDEVMDRLVKRLGEDSVVEDVHTYAFGIARNVSREDYLRSTRSEPLTDALPLIDLETPDSSPASAEWVSIFREALAELNPVERELVINYYSAEPSDREKLAERLGITRQSLRVSASRVRTKLEKLVSRRTHDKKDLGAE